MLNWNKMSHNTNYTHTYGGKRHSSLKPDLWSILALYGPYSIYCEVRAFIRPALRGAEVLWRKSSRKWVVNVELYGALCNVTTFGMRTPMPYGASGPHCRIKLAVHVNHTYGIPARAVGQRCNFNPTHNSVWILRSAPCIDKHSIQHFPLQHNCTCVLFFASLYI